MWLLKRSLISLLVIFLILPSVRYIIWITFIFASWHILVSQHLVPRCFNSKRTNKETLWMELGRPRRWVWVRGELGVCGWWGWASCLKSWKGVFSMSVWGGYTFHAKCEMLLQRCEEGITCYLFSLCCHQVSGSHDITNEKWKYMQMFSLLLYLFIVSQQTCDVTVLMDHIK